MQSPKGSSKHSLVTYGSDLSDEELESLSNIPLPTQEPSNDASDLRSMDISPISNDSKSGYSNEEASPKEINVEIIQPKKRKTNESNIAGLVSYGMDDDDAFDDDYEDGEDDDDNELYLNLPNRKDSSNEKEAPNIEEREPVNVDNEECFNIEGRESDIEIDDVNRPAGDVDMKSRSGQSSSKVKAIVHTKRPKGSELAYVLSRQIHNNPNDIRIPSLTTAKPPPEIEQKMAEIRAKASNSRWNMTQSILHNKAYRNPSIYEKLIEHMKIDERGTNYPPELYDPYRFGDESYYEVLSRAQESAERKRQEQAGGGGGAGASKPNKSNASAMSMTKSSEMRMRKTKWDTGSQKPHINKTYSSGSAVVIETKVMFPTHK